MSECNKKICEVEEEILSSVVSAKKIEYHDLYKKMKIKYSNFNLAAFSSHLARLVRENYVIEDRCRDSTGKVCFVEISPTPFYELLKAAKS